ncbi:MAG: hypothetical protein ABEJ90_04300 [Halobacterium sp.]
MPVGRAVDAVRRPEYTGENRCLPCTVLNLALVAAAGVALGVALTPPAGATVLVVGVLLVAVRGYVVPGTPTLTARYLPDRVHAWFEHGPDAAVPGEAAVENPGDADIEFDPERILVDVGALAPCRDGDDLCLDSLFRAEWRAAMAPAADDLDAAFHTMLPEDVDAPANVETRGEAVSGVVADTRVAQWPSRAAFVADAAGAVALSAADPNWDDRGFDEQTRLLAGLRLWLEQCSVCDGRVELGEDTVESCCRSMPVVAASCTACGARIFEAPHPEK